MTILYFMKEFSTLSATQTKQYGKQPYNFLISGSRDPADTPSDKFITPHPDLHLCFLNSKPAHTGIEKPWRENLVNSLVAKTRYEHEEWFPG